MEILIFRREQCKKKILLFRIFPIEKKIFFLCTILVLFYFKGRKGAGRAGGRLRMCERVEREDRGIKEGERTHSMHLKGIGE